MANYELAYKKLRDEERGYSNHPSDSGKETYAGITRRYNPNWKGWHLIDIAKEDADNFPQNLARILPLQELVKEFYFSEYWKKILGDDICDQHYANLVLSYSVNLGFITGVMLIQKTLKVKIDGIFGPNTLKALNASYSFIDDFKFNVIRRYIEVLREDAKNFDFIDGWINRLEHA